MGKLFLILFSCLSCAAQLPVVPLVLKSAGVTPCVPATYTVSSGTLIVYLDSTCTSSITNTADASNLTNWFDLSGNTTNSFKVDTSLFGVNNRPVLYNTGGGPGGKASVNFFFDALNQRSISMTNTLGLAQPVTLFLLCSFTNISGGHGLNLDTTMDTLTGGREQIAPTLPAGNTGIMFAGSPVNPPGTYPYTNQFIVNMICFDGASSIWRTNNVDYFGGNPGANGLGKIILGTDQGGQTQGKFAACLFLVYKGHLTTNDMTTVYTTIKSEFGLP